MAIPAWLIILSCIFISIGLLSATLILADIYLVGYREHVKIMEAVWPLTALYAGPIALAAYAAWGRTTHPDGSRPAAAPGCRSRSGPGPRSAPPTAAQATS